MLHHIAVIFEYIAIVITLHRIYNRKIRLDIGLIGLCLLSLAIVEFVTYFELNNIFTIIIYLFLALYCMHRYNDTVIGSIVSVLLLLAVTVILQFIAIFPCSYFFPESRELQMLSTNGLVTAAVIWILPWFKLHKLREIFRRSDIYIVVIFGTVMTVILMIMLEGKVGEQIDLALFVLAVPMLIIFLWGLNKWNIAREEAEHSKNELSANKAMQGNYEDLLTSVRLREHSFKNHLAALLSIRYTSRSYDELVNEQDRYYAKICEENKYNKLLLLGDSVLVGFLYEKFRAAETLGVEVIYELRGSFSQSTVPVYYLIDMLGLLIDNAIEAQDNSTETKRLRIQFEEKEAAYQIKVSNPHSYVSYTEIESWFQLGKSSKGNNRGLGLYNLKKICEKYSASIICKNNLYEDENWIEFILEIEKADK